MKRLRPLCSALKENNMTDVEKMLPNSLLRNVLKDNKMIANSFYGISSDYTDKKVSDLQKRVYEYLGIKENDIMANDKLIYATTNYKYDPACLYFATEREYDKMCKTYKKTELMPGIKKIIFNNPATIVYWEDGEKTVVKCDKDTEFSYEAGLAEAVLMRYMHNITTKKDKNGKFSVIDHTRGDIKRLIKSADGYVEKEEEA